MAIIKVELPQEVIDGFCAHNGYKEMVDGAANPETKEDFIKNGWIRRLKADYAQYKIDVDTATIASQIKSDVMSNPDIK